MKIICIGSNYIDHINELNNSKPDEPVVFMKPDTSVLKNNAPFYLPSFSNNVHHEIELIVKINKEGKHVAEKFVERYFEEVGLGIDFTARDLQQQLKLKGLPWEKAKAFNHSAPISRFINKNEFEDLHNLNFRLEVNGKVRQNGNTNDMILKIPELIAYVSKYFTLKKGDIIFTGTPAGVESVRAGDSIKAYLESQCLFDFEVK